MIIENCKRLMKKCKNISKSVGIFILKISEDEKNRVHNSCY